MAAPDAILAQATEDTRQMHTRVVWVLALFMVAWWPTDFLIFDDPERIEDFARLRIAYVATSLPVWGLGRLLKGQAFRLYAGLGPLFYFPASWALGPIIADPTQPYFYGFYIVPFSTALFLLPLPERILTTALYVLVWFVGTVVLYDTPLQDLGSPIAYGSFAAAGAIFTGHLLYGYYLASLQARDALQASEAELSRVMDARSRLFANLTHDLRTPLTVVDLALGDLPPSEQADAARRNIARLRRLVDRFLLLARADADRLEPRRRPTAVMDVARQVAGWFATQRHVDVEGDVGWVELDPDLFADAVYNLVANAVRYAPTGRILIGLSHVDSVLVVRVEDEGPGLPADPDSLFERFHQGDADGAGGGSGIGLSIVAEVAASHGGSVHAENTGLGARFCLRIPAGACPPPAEPAAEVARPLLPTATAVVVDDDDELRAWLVRALPDDWAVTAFPDGEAAWRHLCDPLISRPDVVISDLMMPRCDGLELTRRVRADDRLKGVPILLLTAVHSDAERVRLLEAGASGWLTKPFDKAELRARLAELVRSGSAVRSGERAQLARDLHDEFGQLLTALQLEVAVLARTGDAQVAARLQDLVEPLMEALRTTLAGLDAGRLPLETSLQRVVARSGLDVDLDLDDVPAARRGDVVRVTQEILTNAVRHGGATRARVRCGVEDGISLEVHHDGTLPEELPLRLVERVTATGGTVTLSDGWSVRWNRPSS